jgi:hypothetical protein
MRTKLFKKKWNSAIVKTVIYFWQIDSSLVYALIATMKMQEEISVTNAKSYLIPQQNLKSISAISAKKSQLLDLQPISLSIYLKHKNNYRNGSIPHQKKDNGLRIL